MIIRKLELAHPGAERGMAALSRDLYRHAGRPIKRRVWLRKPGRTWRRVIAGHARLDVLQRGNCCCYKCERESECEKDQCRSMTVHHTHLQRKLE